MGKAIKRSRTVSFRYRKNGRLTDKVFKVSPYFLIISGGWYYLICNTDGRDALSHYRIDRMEQVEMNFERGRDFYSVESVDEFLKSQSIWKSIHVCHMKSQSVLHFWLMKHWWKRWNWNFELHQK
ncbi:MAG: WYL domain-containing protein [Clostridium sp.]